MTVSTSENLSNSYVADGIETEFEIRFKWYDSSEIKVYVDDVLQGSGYSVVTQAGDPDGSNDAIVIAHVVFDVAPADTLAVYLERDLNISQEIDFLSYGKFPADSNENGLDKVTLIAKDINTRFLALRAEYDALVAAIVDDLTTGGSTVPLSAQQGVALKALIDAVEAVNTTQTSDIDAAEARLDVNEADIDALEALVASNILPLDTMQEVADFVTLARADLDELILNGGVGLGTVTSVGVSGTDGIEVDSGSPVTGADTIVLGLNKIATLAFLNVQDGATDDQTGAEIKAAYEAEADTNAFTDAEKTVVGNTSGINSGDQTGADIKTAYEAEADTNALTDALLAKLNAAVNSPTGSIHAVAYDASSSTPSGYLYCGGAAVSRTTYADLFALLGTTHGAGDGSTTFNLPDYRGRFLRGLDDGIGLDTGRAIGSYQTSDNKSHSHAVTVNSDSHSHTASSANDTHNHSITVNNDSHSHDFRAQPNTNAGTSGGTYMGNTRLGSGGGNVSYTGSVRPDTHNHTASSANDTHNHSITVNSDSHSHTASSATDGGAESRPENASVTYIIKY